LRQARLQRPPRHVDEAAHQVHGKCGPGSLWRLGWISSAWLHTSTAQHLHQSTIVANMETFCYRNKASHAAAQAGVQTVMCKAHTAQIHCWWMASHTASLPQQAAAAVSPATAARTGWGPAAQTVPRS
jgi:hypothetical protein